ncbi:hypothetical protein A3Q56_00275 [Intoshia linei]|uniref:Uncharacterized protein n=1 Tax=Intoshia linei TaxID=1819745 RepID=A0A177BEH8_9BILA|nr:hypothetical protein A3Q56_00275 [Intoshia linei]
MSSQEARRGAYGYTTLLILCGWTLVSCPEKYNINLDPIEYSSTNEIIHSVVFIEKLNVFIITQRNKINILNKDTLKTEKEIEWVSSPEDVSNCLWRNGNQMKNCYNDVLFALDYPNQDKIILCGTCSMKPMCVVLNYAQLTSKLIIIDKDFSNVNILTKRFYESYTWTFIERSKDKRVYIYTRWFNRKNIMYAFEISDNNSHFKPSLLYQRRTVSKSLHVYSFSKNNSIFLIYVIGNSNMNLEYFLQMTNLTSKFNKLKKIVVVYKTRQFKNFEILNVLEYKDSLLILIKIHQETLKSKRFICYLDLDKFKVSQLNSEKNNNIPCLIIYESSVKLQFMRYIIYDEIFNMIKVYILSTCSNVQKNITKLILNRIQLSECKKKFMFYSYTFINSTGVLDLNLHVSQFRKNLYSEYLFFPNLILKYEVNLSQKNKKRIGTNLTFSINVNKTNSKCNTIIPDNNVSNFNNLLFKLSNFKSRFIKEIKNVTIPTTIASKNNTKNLKKFNSTLAPIQSFNNLTRDLKSLKMGKHWKRNSVKKDKSEILKSDCIETHKFNYIVICFVFLFGCIMGIMLKMMINIQIRNSKKRSKKFYINENQQESIITTKRMSPLGQLHTLKREATDLIQRTLKPRNLNRYNIDSTCSQSTDSFNNI